MLTRASTFSKLASAVSGPLSRKLARTRLAGVASLGTFSDRAIEASFDLCYCNGVFHHIPPHERLGAARLIFRSLARGGHFALFENNPLNPGTRMVMRRIP